MKNLGLGATLQKKTTNPAEIESMVKQLHNREGGRGNPPLEVAKVEKLRKTSFDLPVGLYKAIHRRLLDEDRSFKEYILGLIEKDMKWG